MRIVSDIAAAFSLWIEAIARLVNARVASLNPVCRIEVVEQDADIFTMQIAPKARAKGGDLLACRIDMAGGNLNEPLSPEWCAAVQGGVVELVLRPSRFVFRPLELPKRAGEFLDGIIRAQIDRLTPWNAADAVFRWTRPCDVAGERIALTVVAIGRNTATSFAQVFADLGAAGVEISTAATGGERIIVHRLHAGAQRGLVRIRFGLVAGLATAGVLAALSLGAGGFIVDSYDAQYRQIQQRIGERRAILRGGQSGSASSPLELLVRRKHTTPSSVLVMDALSALLPDHTYATEVRIEGDKLQIVGITRDAPSLIQILEQSPHFAGAGFFAPTTRAANEPGERFHIEARLKPHFGFGT